MISFLKRQRLVSALQVSALCLASVPAAMAQSSGSTSPGALAESLIKLRSEVEQLNTEVEIQRQENRTRAGSLAATRAELEAGVKRQELNVRQLREDLAKREQTAAGAGVAADVLLPVLQQAIATLEAQIQSGFPFKRAERLAEVAELKAQLQAGTMPAPRVANRLWALYEDEFRLTRENGLHSQTITVEGKDVLADVAKIGNLMLFFRTPDGRFGKVVAQGSDWRYELSSDDAERKRIADLFDSLRKQIRQGWFELPNTLAAGAR